MPVRLIGSAVGPESQDSRHSSSTKSGHHAYVPLRPGDEVVFVGPGPDPTPDSWERHDPTGEPRPADYGSVVDVEQGAATVAWRFGRSSSVPISQLYRRNENGPMRRYNVTYENIHKIEDA